MSYAIIETGGKQVRVEPGRFYDIELLPVEAEGSVTIESVLLVQHDGEVTIGQPFIQGATVEGTVLRHFRGRKVLVYKMKPKKKTRKKRGHRQEITRLMINSISMNGSALASSSAQQEETPVTDQTPAEAPTTEEPVGATLDVEQEETPVTDQTPAEAPTTEEPVGATSDVEQQETPVTDQTPAEASTTEETSEAASDVEQQETPVTDQTPAEASTTEETTEAASE
jgi:large subunit ribosomal protein L21